MKKIPIFFTFDNNYVIPAAVAFYSLLNKAKDGVFYNMYILHSDITLENQELLQNIILKKNNAKLEFINTGNFLKKEWNNGNFEGHNSRTQFTVETIMKCFPAHFFQDIDKIIYSDVDIVVVDDISELIDINIDDCYIAGVKNVFMKYSDMELSHLNDKYFQRLKDSYIGGGIWVMNLKKMRSDDLISKMLKITQDNNITKRWPDQDIINIACENKVKFIPLNYISLPYLIDYITQNDFTSHYTKDELYDSIINPKIIHYAGIKPWNGNPKKASIWWEIFHYLDLPKTKIFITNDVNDDKKLILKCQIKNIYYGILLTISNIPFLSNIFSTKFKEKMYKSINKYKY